MNAQTKVSKAAATKTATVSNKVETAAPVIELETVAPVALPHVRKNDKSEVAAFLTSAETETEYTLASKIGSTTVTRTFDISTPEHRAALAHYLESSVTFFVERVYKDGSIQQPVTVSRMMADALAGAGIAERLSTNTAEKDKGLDWLTAFSADCPTLAIYNAVSKVAPFSWPVFLDSLIKKTREDVTDEQYEQFQVLADKYSLKQLLGMSHALADSPKWVWLRDLMIADGWAKPVLDLDDDLI